MTNKSIKLNSSDIINTRTEISKKKNLYWNSIMSFNLMSKKEIKAGMRKKDPKSLYNEIVQMSEKLVYIKGMLAYLNMGYTTFNKEDFKKTNNYNIFMATEKKELISKLTELKSKHTIDPKVKATKGLKNIGKEEVFTSAKIDALIKKLNQEANTFDMAMADFNDNTDIDITSLGEDFAKNFAA